MDTSEAVLAMKSIRCGDDLEEIFEAHYARIARGIARIIRDPGRAEELAVEVFLKWARSASPQNAPVERWLYRSAARMALDELRRRARHYRYERRSIPPGPPPDPEQLHSIREEQDRVIAVLGIIEQRHAELLLLRNQGLSYDELALALELNPVSIGTLLNRARAAFRKEYVRKYEDQEDRRR